MQRNESRRQNPGGRSLGHVAILAFVTPRRAKPSDAAALLNLWFQLSADGHSADHRYHVADRAEETMLVAVTDWTTGEQPTWVAEVNEEIVGFIVSRRATTHPVLRLPPALIITDAYVSEPHRRRGVGRRLVETVREFARTRGFSALEVGTLTHDERAVGFWRSLGFGDWRITLSLDLSIDAT